ncbi:uncharacterized protein LOC106171729 isoform X1 [Lingula anatina]|uniref:beta-N-acetylhexosaminidase n=1 Tax=Lingula anatina TaxID=7574 RepID=A0A1S3JCL8_LINAN|nr:uncharacterized protein LOC106171729 isoform X1 [Lingula anatina]|eukprot:XP_013407629.1 uncharacterized protein LOC106171729 isoform X1 [Lingula anatina]
MSPYLLRICRLLPPSLRCGPNRAFQICAAVVVIYILYKISGISRGEDEVKTHIASASSQEGGGAMHHQPEETQNKGVEPDIPPGSTEEMLRYISNNLDVYYEVVDNTGTIDDIDKAIHKVQVTLTNEGEATITATGTWSIYFYMVFMLQNKQWPYPEGYVIRGSGFKLYHVGGHLFCLTPLTDTKITPGEKVVIKLDCQAWSVAKTDVMPNWYVTAEGHEPQIIQCTAGETLAFVAPFSRPQQYKRLKQDQFNPFTPSQRYEKNDKIKYRKDGLLLVIPTPVELRADRKRLISFKYQDWVLAMDKELDVSVFVDKLNEMGVKLSSGSPPATKVIRVAQGSVSIKLDGRVVENHPESYSLTVNGRLSRIDIVAPASPGAFYAMQSLFALMNEEGAVPHIVMKDAPRFIHRGLMLDVARNFFPPEDLYPVMEVMAMFKMNKLHLHLSDDEGWRVEIEKLPELTEIGGRRRHDLSEKTGILPQLGSGPHDMSSGSGYYTASDYRDILKYATDRHIEIIPEIDLPGHAHAAVRAMEARYARLMKAGKSEEAGEFRLRDPADTSQYKSVQKFTDGVVNPCLESTFRFVEEVIKGLIKLHQEVAPLKRIHIGGDEVPAGVWEGSPACSGRQRKEIQEGFVRRVAKIAADLDLDITTWDDGMLHEEKPFERSSIPNKQPRVNAWMNPWEWGAAGRGYAMANAGYEVIMTQATHLYFDHAYEPDPEERGFYWATRYTDTERVFGFMPDDLWANLDKDLWGNKLTLEKYCKDFQCTKLEKPENIVGMEACLWSETVRMNHQMESMLFPRAIALAERAWHKDSWELVTNPESRERAKRRAWELFANTLGQKELPRLDMMQVSYRLPPPGVKVMSGKLYANCAFPGLQIVYAISKDKAEEEEDMGIQWIPYSEPVSIQGFIKVKVATRFEGSKYTSRVITMNIAPRDKTLL